MKSGSNPIYYNCKRPDGSTEALTRGELIGAIVELRGDDEKRAVSMGPDVLRIVFPRERQYRLADILPFRNPYVLLQTLSGAYRFEFQVFLDAIQVVSPVRNLIHATEEAPKAEEAPEPEEDWTDEPTQPGVRVLLLDSYVPCT